MLIPRSRGSAPLEKCVNPLRTRPAVPLRFLEMIVIASLSYVFAIAPPAFADNKIRGCDSVKHKKAKYAVNINMGIATHQDRDLKEIERKLEGVFLGIIVKTANDLEVKSGGERLVDFIECSDRTPLVNDKNDQKPEQRYDKDILSRWHDNRMILEVWVIPDWLREFGYGPYETDTGIGYLLVAFEARPDVRDRDDLSSTTSHLFRITSNLPDDERELSKHDVMKAAIHLVKGYAYLMAGIEEAVRAARVDKTKRLSRIEFAGLLYCKAIFEFDEADRVNPPHPDDDSTAQIQFYKGLAWEKAGELLELKRIEMQKAGSVSASKSDNSQDGNSVDPKITDLLKNAAPCPGLHTPEDLAG